MEIDFKRFEEFLTKKDKKNPYYRPLTSLPCHRQKNLSTLESFKEQSVFRRPEKIGYTVRLPSYERKLYHNMRSVSMYDPMSLQQKLFKVSMGNDANVRQIVLRKSKQNTRGCESYNLKQILGDKLKTCSGDENCDPKHKYQKKKLRVVKGKASSYKLRTKIKADSLEMTDQDENKTFSGSVVGVKLL